MRKVYLLLCSAYLSCAVAQTPPSQPRQAVRQEIAQALQEAENERMKTLRAIEQSASEIVRLRNVAAGDDTLHAQIVEAQTVGRIAETTAHVELIKLQAKQRINREVDRLEHLSRTHTQAYQEARRKAMTNIAKTVAEVEKAKAKATRKILEVTKEAEARKAQPTRYIDEEAALRIAQSDAKVRIAKAVSSVEIAEAVMKVELCKCLSDEDKAALRTMDATRIDLPKIEAKAKAAIAEAKADIAVAKARAMSKIARAVATVEIAKAIVAKSSAKKSHTASSPATPRIRGHYPTRFVTYK